MKTINKKLIFAGFLAVAAVAQAGTEILVLKQILPPLVPCTKFFSSYYALQKTETALPLSGNQCFKTNQSLKKSSSSNNNSQYGQNRKFYTYRKPFLLWSGLCFTVTAVIVPTCLLVKKCAARSNTTKKDKSVEANLKLPSKQEIIRILQNLGLDHFAEKTKFAEQLGGEQRAPLGVAIALELAIADYLESFGNTPKRRVMQINMLGLRPAVLNALLSKYPREAQKLLQELGLNKSADKSKIERQ